MNKNLYRVIFNKTRGLHMAVSEAGTRQGKTSGIGQGAGRSAAPVIATLRTGTFQILLALGLASIILPAASQIVAAPGTPAVNQANQPTITAAQNGVTVINIQKASAAGVSRNVYSQFDVNKQGVILNNSHTYSNTQLGGWIQGNSNLSSGHAKVILNEVNSANPSQLSGYVEVGGTRAQVVVANPAGLTCDGCGFLNASRVTLTTGAPIMNNGALEGYNVRGGAVKIQGGGGVANKEGSQKSTTQSGISGADINITDEAKQKELTGKDADTTLASLNRDVSSDKDSSNSLTKSWDGQKLQEQVEAQAKILATFNEEASKALKEYANSKTKAYLDAFNEKLAIEGKMNTTATMTQEQQAALLARTDELKAIMDAHQDDYDKWKDSGSMRVLSNIILAVVSQGETGLASASLQESMNWVNFQLHQKTLESSRQFAGICDTKGTCYDHISGPSAGAYGIKVKHAGSRIDVDDLCNDGRCSKDPLTGTWAKDDMGHVIMNKFDQAGNPVDLAKLYNPTDPFGGGQGKQGTIFGFPYTPGRLPDKLQENVGAGHDYLNSFFGYNADGTTRSNMSTSEKVMFNVMNVVNLVGAVPLGVSSLTPSDVWNAVNVILKARK